MVNFFNFLITFSSYSKNTTHARNMVLQHVAMEEPRKRDEPAHLHPSNKYPFFVTK